MYSIWLRNPMNLGVLTVCSRHSAADALQLAENVGYLPVLVRGSTERLLILVPLSFAFDYTRYVAVQQAAANELSRLNTEWQEGVRKNMEIEAACDALQEEVALLKAKAVAL